MCLWFCKWWKNRWHFVHLGTLQDVVRRNLPPQAASGRQSPLPLATFQDTIIDLANRRRRMLTACNHWQHDDDVLPLSLSIWLSRLIYVQVRRALEITRRACQRSDEVFLLLRTINGYSRTWRSVTRTFQIPLHHSILIPSTTRELLSQTLSSQIVSAYGTWREPFITHTFSYARFCRLKFKIAQSLYESTLMSWKSVAIIIAVI